MKKCWKVSQHIKPKLKPFTEDDCFYEIYFCLMFIQGAKGETGLRGLPGLPGSVSDQPVGVALGPEVWSYTVVN